MTWQLNVVGRTPPPEGSDQAWHDTEHRLMAELHAVLAKPEYAVATAMFRGRHLVSNSLHLTTPEAPVSPAAADVPDDAPAKSASRRGKGAEPADDKA